MISRRSLLSVAAASLAGCRPNRTHGFAGFAFVANEDGQAIAAVDLTAFAVARHIHLPGKPRAIAAPAAGTSVFALTPETGSVHEIDASKLALKRSARVAAGALSMRLSPDEKALWILCARPNHLVRVSTESLKVEADIALTEEPESFDVSRSGALALVGAGSSGKVAIVDLDKRSVARRIQLDGAVGLVSFRSDDRCVMAGNIDRSMLSLFDTATGAVVTHLPLAVRPRNFCMRSDGGQMFLTGEGMDAVVVIYPHNTPMVAETVLAGRTPSALAISTAIPDLLFVANPEVGNVTILDVVTRKVIGIVAVGAEPAYVTTTPDSQYALVLNRRSGDMAVIRVAGFTAKRSKFAALFTMIPVGSRPVCAAVKAV